MDLLKLIVKDLLRDEVFDIKMMLSWICYPPVTNIVKVLNLDDMLSGLLGG